MSLLNGGFSAFGAGLSAMGQGVASFAGTAGLEAQKSALAQQGMVLANQLAHTSRTEEIAQGGSIAATAAEAAHGYRMGELGVSTASAERIANIGAGATLGAAGIAAATSRANTAAVIAANAPLAAAQTQNALATAQISGSQAQLANQSLDLTKQILEETAKPPAQQDADKLTALTNQRAQLSMTTETQAKLLGSITDLAKTSQQSAIMLDTNVARILGQEKDLNMGDPKIRDAQKAEEASAIAQRDQAVELAQYYANVAKSYAGKMPNAPPAAPAQPGKPIDLNKFLAKPAAPAPSTAGPGRGPGTAPGLILDPSTGLPPNYNQ